MDTSTTLPEDITAKEQTLDIIKNRIEKMGKTQHIEILNILKKNTTVKLNENRNGVYINLSYLPNDVIEELQKYLDYLKDQETNLQQMEIQKEEFKTTIECGIRSGAEDIHAYSEGRRRSPEEYGIAAV